MALRLHNTLSGEKEEFVPADPAEARVYVCGPTVYDYAHLGHLRCYVVYDILIRHLRASGQKVKYVRNITDVNDSIMKRAAERDEDPVVLAERFTEAFHEDMARVGNLEPDVEPKVSEHIEEIQSLIGRLIENGHAYVADGDVYFEVGKCSDYGKLSHRKLDEMLVGGSGRTEEHEAARKRSPVDFALWKGAPEGELGWISPWGYGRPGWHIECSAMSMKHLGESFDLHGGGLDLIFPHHENEVAQSECATGKPFARMWIHNGFVEVDKTKMSKSLGNFFTAREVFERVEPEALRYFVMTAHYRAPLNLDWTMDQGGGVKSFPLFEDAEVRIEYLYGTLRRLRSIPEGRIVERPVEGEPVIPDLRAYLLQALDDDLAFPAALARVAEVMKAINELCDFAARKKGKVSATSIAKATSAFEALSTILGLGAQEPVVVLERIRDRRARARGLDPAEVLNRIEARKAARAEKDFARADQLRDDLAILGVELHDSPEGTTWSIPLEREDRVEQ